MMQPPILLERDHTSITVMWDRTEDAMKYELQICETDGDDSQWRSLSASLSSNFVRKKNLVAGSLYRFRVRFECTSGWGDFSASSEPFEVFGPEVRIMVPPVLASKGCGSLTLGWEAPAKAEGFRVRFRTDLNGAWQAVGGDSHVIRGEGVKKKGLEFGRQYYFSIRPLVSEDCEERWGWSVSSPAYSVARLEPAMQQLMPANLLARSGSLIATGDALCGKVVAVYFSAHWCGPCRQFTPQLASVYAQAKAAGKPFEIVFCSCDHDAKKFLDYYNSSHPWLAIPFEDRSREMIQSKFSVSGIPMLSVLAPTGQIMEKNAVQSISMASIDAWIARAGI